MSLVLLSLIGGGSLINHASAASNHYQPVAHTYRLINFTSHQATAKAQARPVTAKGNPSTAPTKTYPLYNQPKALNTTQKSWIKPVVNQDAVTAGVNRLSPYQIANYGGQTVSRTVMPFDRVHINRPVQLHTSVFFNQNNGGPTINNCTVRILKSFNQYCQHNVYVRYLINVNHHDYFITGNPQLVSFVAPSNRPDYYQNKINGLLNGPEGQKLDSIKNSLNDLDQLNITDYRPYMNLYLDAYNLVQEMHPVAINVAKPKPQRVDASSTVLLQNDPQGLKAISGDIQKDLHLINSYGMVAATYDHNTMSRLRNLPLTSENESHANYLESSLLNEINSNNALIDQVNQNTHNVINNLNDPLSLDFDLKEVNFQITMAHEVATDAERIYNQDYPEFVQKL